MRNYYLAPRNEQFSTRNSWAPVLTMVTTWFQVCSVLSAAVTTQALVIPFYNNYFKQNVIENPEYQWFFDTVSPYTVPFHYNPRTSHLINIAYISSLCGYFGMSTVGTLLDLFPATFLKYKTQGNRSYFTVWEWLEAILVACLNLLVFSWSVTLPCCWLWVRLHGESYDQEVSGGTLDFNWLTAAVHLIIILVVIDFWFYTTHRVLHFPFFYKWIHKFHHRFKAPTSVASVYANPIEFTIGNHLGVALGPVLTNCHPYLCYFWFFFALWNTGGAHSGYRFFGAEGHDIHHELFNYNYGVGGLMDYLCGTGYSMEKKQKRLAKKRS